MPNRLHLLTVTLLLANPSYASTHTAWNKSQQAIAQSCLQASSLKESRIAGEVVDFDDEAGFSALLIEGRYPQPFMKELPGKELCLFARKSHKVFIQTADKLDSNPRQ